MPTSRMSGEMRGFVSSTVTPSWMRVETFGFFIRKLKSRTFVSRFRMMFVP